MEEDNYLVVYTDGGCHGNPGPGGWGAVIIDGNDVRELSGGEKATTNNRMELTAAISVLQTVSNEGKWAGKTVRVFIDSQYVKNGITSWIAGWKRNGWRTAAKKPVLNRDLWERLDSLASSLTVQWVWVKGHAGVKYNEVCDQLCQKEISKFE
ncbi:MAG: ribonuclease HI [Treponema sp.]|nr:ribonuclease HI [Treponema sp.]